MSESSQYSGESHGKAPESAEKAPDHLDAGEGISAGSEKHDRVSELLADLTKTARSFLLYDARNAAIHRFLSDLLGSFQSVLSDYGDLELSIQTFEIFYEGQCIYLNRDRERSLAFRLYRDGVRALTFRQGFDGEEMAKLLEILSIRYTGVQQCEEDLVTLLWKAEFKNIEILSVEGIVQDENEVENPILPTTSSAQMEGFESAPQEPVKKLGMLGPIDLPGPYLPERGRVRWIEVDPADIAALKEEVSEAYIANECMQLLAHVEAWLDDPKERMRLDEISHVFTEILDFLLTEEHLPYFRKYLDVLRHFYETPAPPWDLGRQSVVQGLFERGGSVEAVRRLLRTMEETRQNVPDDLLHVLDELSQDPLAVVAEVVLSERRDLPIAVVQGLFERYGAEQLDRLVDYYYQSEMPLTLTIFQVIAKLGADRQAEFITEQLGHPHEDIQRQALHYLRHFPYNNHMGKAMMGAFKEGSFEIRMLLMPVMFKFQDSRFVGQLAQFIDHDGDRLSIKEAHEIGSKLGPLGGRRYQKLWLEWLKPIGLVGKQLSGHRCRQLVAAAALAEFPGDQNLKVLRTARGVADSDLQPWFSRCISRQRGVQLEARR